MTTTFTPSTGTTSITLENWSGTRLPATGTGCDSTGSVDSTSDMQTASSNSECVELPSGSYKLSQFPTDANHQFIGLGDVALNFFVGTGGNTVFANLSSGCEYNNLQFNGAGGDIENTYTGVSGTNIHAYRCGFNNFTNPTNNNAWGNLIREASSVVLDHCTYSNNTYADIALTDNVSNITIIQPYNANGVTLDIEPTTSTGVSGLNCIGGHYKSVMLLEPSATAYASAGNTFTGGTVDTLDYSGAGMKFTGTKINAITGVAVSGVTYAGDLMCDTFDLFPNMITNPYVTDFTSGTSYWECISGSGSTTSDPNGSSYFTMNSGKISQHDVYQTRNFIAAWEFQTYIGFIRNRTDNSGTGGSWADHVQIAWYNGATLISTTTVLTARAAVNATSSWCNDVFVINSPANCTQFKVSIANSMGGAASDKYDVSAIGIYPFNNFVNGLGNMASVISAMATPHP